MNRIKDVLRRITIVMILSVVAIIVLESECMSEVREYVILLLPFLDGKRAVFSNIFLGIFASAFCMCIGEVANLKYMKKELENEIRELLDEIWIKLNFKNGNDRQSYINNSKIIMQYQERIQRLYREYTNKKSHEYNVIFFLDWVLKYYKAIYENEYMKDNNITLFKVWIEEYLKPFNGDLNKLYFLSVQDEEIMKLRKEFEKVINGTSEYITSRESQTNKYINDIKKIEKNLNEAYDMQLLIEKKKRKLC